MPCLDIGQLFQMNAIHQIVDNAPDMIPVPPVFRHLRIEIVFRECPANTESEPDKPVMWLSELAREDFGFIPNKRIRERQPGLGKGNVFISEDFDEPLPDEFWLGEEER